MRLKKFQKAELVRIVEYVITGGAYFWSGYLVFAICDKGFHWNLWWAKLTANVVGVSVNFALSRWWVFKGRTARKDLNQVSGRYIVITGVNFVIDYFIIYGLKTIGISPYIGQFVSAGFFSVWNYLWYRLWVFAALKVPRRKPRPRIATVRAARPATISRRSAGRGPTRRLAVAARRSSQSPARLSSRKKAHRGK